MLQRLITLCQTGGPWEPTGSARSIMARIAEETPAWEEHNLSGILGLDSLFPESKDLSPVVLMLNSTILDCVQTLIKKHPIASAPVCVKLKFVDGESNVIEERVIGEYWTGDIHLSTHAATKQRFGDNVITIMIKLWSDDTNLGGNDRLPVKVFRIRIGNHPLSFSKTDAGQAIIGLMTNTLRAPSELQDNNQCLIVFSV